MLKGTAQIETLLFPPKTPFSLNYEQDLTMNKVAQRYVKTVADLRRRSKGAMALPEGENSNS